MADRHSLPSRSLGGRQGLPHVLPEFQSRRLPLSLRADSPLRAVVPVGPADMALVTGWPTDTHYSSAAREVVTAHGMSCRSSRAGAFVSRSTGVPAPPSGPGDAADTMALASKWPTYTHCPLILCQSIRERRGKVRLVGVRLSSKSFFREGKEPCQLFSRCRAL